MAKENTARFFGIVQKIVCRKDPDSDEFKSGRAVITAVSKARMTSRYLKEGPKRTDNIIIFSREPKVIEYMSNARPGSVVAVKGTLCSQDVERTYVCPECGEKTILVRSTTEYVDPIYFGVRAYRKSKPEDGEGFQFGTDTNSIKEYVHSLQAKGEYLTNLTTDGVVRLIAGFENTRYLDSRGISILDDSQIRYYMTKQGEIGNEVCAFGTLTRKPEPSDFFPGDGHHSPSFKFQVAINRLRHIYSDDPDKKTDFIYVVVYGRLAEFYFNNLKMGSTIYFAGPLLTRTFIRKVTCQNCGCVYEVPGLATEVKAQHIEFAKNCGTEMTDVGEDDYADIVEAEEERERELLDSLTSGETEQEETGGE